MSFGFPERIEAAIRRRRPHCKRVRTGHPTNMMHFVVRQLMMYPRLIPFPLPFYTPRLEVRR
ncbi:protein US33A [Panine betaherpesvirus 2]|uniref:Protein US33A n=1 Tax=Panine betaherpesvirus 2 TaxID=188763 RepID=G9VYW8_9BETA|nr:protein US33A [Panine betaherpesvirus 2]AEV81013.1 protein US33A [Panine betaherpesvirus 2]QXV67929.1 protein US33A [Panine betaherpesvirus 2]